jgi:precorrin-6B methylase 2
MMVPTAMALEAGVEAMASLRALLDDQGYAQLYTALAGDGIFPSNRDRAVAIAAALGGEARALLHLFACAEPIDASSASAPVRAVVSALARAGLASSDAGTLRLDDLVVVATLGGYLLTAPPPGWHRRRGPGRAYLGEDSLLLAKALPSARGKAVLDLGAGCGIQGLLAAQGASRVVLSDIEDRSIELGIMNAHLNGLAERTEVVAGDCYEAVSTRRFDLVVTLPPYLPSLAETHDEVVAAGPDGLGLLRRIIAGAGDHLLPGGELVALAQLLCDDDGPLLRQELDALSPSLDARLSCFDPHPLQPYVLELATKLSIVSEHPTAYLHTRLMAQLRALGATGICTAFLRLRMPKALTSPHTARGCSVVWAPRWTKDTVLAPVRGLRIGIDKSLFAAGIGDGPTTPLRGPTAALLSAFDGRSDLGQVAARAWGAPAGADRQDLIDQAIERALELERAGLVVPVIA